MNRRDILWIALKLAGLYLITEGVAWIPDAVVEGDLLHQLDAGVPLLAGLVLLGIRVSGTGDARIAGLTGGMTRGDWFWLVCKSLGLWWTFRALLQVPTTIRWLASGSTDWVVGFSVGIYLAAGLLLLFTNYVHRLVVRDDREPNQGVASSDVGVDDAAQQAAAADPLGNYDGCS